MEWNLSYMYFFNLPTIRSIQSLNCVQLCNPMDCSTPGLPVHHQFPELTQTHVHWIGDATQHLMLCRPLLLPPSIFPSIRVSSNESVLCNRWPKYWSFSFNISPSNEYSGLISFRMDWLDLLAVQGTLKRLLQHRSSKASILQRSAFFIVSHPYLTTGKTIALTRWTFVSKIMFLLSRLVITFLPRSKHLISWLQSLSTVILEPKKIKSVPVSIASPSICYEVLGLDVMISVFLMLRFKSGFSHSSFNFITRLFSTSLLSAVRVVSSTFFSQNTWFHMVFHPVQHFTWCTLHRS